MGSFADLNIETPLAGTTIVRAFLFRRKHKKRRQEVDRCYNFHNEKRVKIRLITCLISGFLRDLNDFCALRGFYVAQSG
jgi:hypothetical protein